MSYHILKTWLIANLMHPVLIGLWFGINDIFSTVGIGGLFAGTLLLLVYSLVFSIPALIFSQLVMYAAARLVKQPALLFFCWYITATLSVLLTYITPFLFKQELDEIFDSITFVIPALLSVSISVVLLHRPFFKMLDNKNAETELVQENG